MFIMTMTMMMMMQSF